MKTITTPFSDIYDVFLAGITDDMYMELTELETYKLLESLLLDAIVWFEFPRVQLLDNYETQEMVRIEEYEGVESDDFPVTIYIWNEGKFNVALSSEEINILATYMKVEWLGQQLASIDNVRQIYSGDDFKFTSQANHISKLTALKEKYEKEGFHKQRLYKRRKVDENGIMKSTLGEIMESSVRGDGFI